MAWNANVPQERRFETTKKTTQPRALTATDCKRVQGGGGYELLSDYYVKKHLGN